MSLCPSGTSNVRPNGMPMSSDLNGCMKECGMESRSLLGTAMPPLHYFPRRANRANFLHAQDELKQRAIPFDCQDHEISHSIYFRDLDGHEIEITTYEL